MPTAYTPTADCLLPTALLARRGIIGTRLGRTYDDAPHDASTGRCRRVGTGDEPTCQRSDFPPIGSQSQEEVVPFTDVPENFVTVNAQNKRVSGLDLRQLTAYLTPEQNYFVVAHYGVPTVDAATWKLDIRGRVGNPRSYTLDELKKRARAQRECTFECGGNRGAAIMNRMVGNARWTGTRAVAAHSGSEADTPTRSK